MKSAAGERHDLARRVIHVDAQRADPGTRAALDAAFQLLAARDAHHLSAEAFDSVRVVFYRALYFHHKLLHRAGRPPACSMTADDTPLHLTIFRYVATIFRYINPGLSTWFGKHSPFIVLQQRRKVRWINQLDGRIFCCLADEMDKAARHTPDHVPGTQHETSGETSGPRQVRFGVPPLGGSGLAPPKGGTPNRVSKRGLKGKSWRLPA